MSSIDLEVAGKNLEDFFSGKDLIFRVTRTGKTETRRAILEKMDVFRKVYTAKLLLESEHVLKRGYLENFDETQRSSKIVSAKVNSDRTYVKYESKNSVYEFRLIKHDDLS